MNSQDKFSTMLEFISQGFSFSFGSNNFITVNHKDLFPAYVYCGDSIDYAFGACELYLEGE